MPPCTVTTLTLLLFFQFVLSRVRASDQAGPPPLPEERDDQRGRRAPTISRAVGHPHRAASLHRRAAAADPPHAGAPGKRGERPHHPARLRIPRVSSSPLAQLCNNVAVSKESRVDSAKLRHEENIDSMNLIEFEGEYLKMNQYSPLKNAIKYFCYPASQM